MNRDTMQTKFDHTRFSVDSGKLLIDGQMIGHSKKVPGFERLIFEPTPIGAGANGVTYRVRHIILGTEQVVKLYFPNTTADPNSYQKAILEASKNADTNLSEVIATVHDAGTYNFPISISYSCMESVSNVITLREWLQNRQRWLDDMNSRPEDHDEGPLFAKKLSPAIRHQALCTATGFLRSVLFLFTQDKTHGDLNQGNILVYQTQKKEIDLRKHHDKIMPHVGTLKADPIKLIDLGSSRAVGTNQSIGLLRDSWHVLDNIRRILKPWFAPGTSLHKWLQCKPIDEANGVKAVVYSDKTNTIESNRPLYVDPRQVATALLRLICVLNLVSGHGENREPRTEESSQNPDADRNPALDQASLSLLNGIINGSKLELTNDVFDPTLLKTAESINSTSDTTSQFLIDWKSLWNDIKLMYPTFHKYSIKINQLDQQTYIVP